MTSPGQRPLMFGIYPGSAVGDDAGGIALGPPDVPGRINDALDELQGPAARPFMVRAYRIFTEAGQPAPRQTPEGFGRYLRRGRTLDLVASYHSAGGDVDGYCAFLEELIDSYGDRIATLQVCEEPNVTGNPNLDGWFPRVAEAIVNGVSAAKAKARRCGRPDLKVGCNSTPLPGAAAGFFTELSRAGDERFTRDLDYVGLDFFPDVFRPLPGPRLGAVVEALLAEHRRHVLAPAGLAHLPLVITEHGWPTGPGRPPERQAEVLTTVIEVVGRNASALNIAGYTHFSLRDACSAEPGLFCQFGLMTDDYVPKPAFHAYQSLIAALGR
jgi:hypothetical protein